MNKQEVLYLPVKIDGLIFSTDNDGCKRYYRTLDSEEVSSSFKAKSKEELLDQLKPVVPKFVADFYESIKDDFEDEVYGLCLQFDRNNGELSSELYEWFECGKNEPIQTLVKMKFYGYEIEQEKLYTVEIPNPNGDSNRYGLCKVDGKIIIGSFVFGLNKAINAKLTESEIKQDFDFLWQFAKPVEVEDDTEA